MIRATMPRMDLTVPRLVDDAWTRHPGISHTFSESGRSRSIPAASVRDRSRQLAGALQGAGLRPGDVVATFMWNTQAHLEAYAAVPSIGAVLLTVNVRLAADEVAYILRHAGARAVIVDAALLSVLEEALAETKLELLIVTGGDGPGSVEGHEVVEYESWLVNTEPLMEWPDIDEDAPAAMCYTSGTTGRPKGVVYSHRSTYLHSMSVCTGNAVAMSAQDTVLVLVPMYHANAWGWPYAAMHSGARLVLPGDDLSASNVGGLIEQHRVTLTGGVPTLWSEMLHELEKSSPDLSSLRLILCGGSAVPSALIDAYEERVGVPLIQAWGMTETSPLGAVARPPADLPDAHGRRFRESQGRLLGGIEARLVDDDGAVLPRDGTATGELQVRGPWVTDGYHGGAGMDSFDDGWLRTGDRGTIDERGYLWLTDRTKDVIKSGGEWISSAQLELALLDSDAVEDALVIGVPDDRWGERPLAVVRLAPGHDFDPEALQRELNGRVPRWWVPERWALVDELPRTSVGKGDKVRLRQQYREGGLDVLGGSRP